jgi:hypothetical protein
MLTRTRPAVENLDSSRGETGRGEAVQLTDLRISDAYVHTRI